MASGLSQLSIRYVKAEDRLVFMFNTRDRKEYRLWLTRRFVAEALWPAIEDLLRQNPEIQRLSDEDAKKAMLSFEHENKVNKEAFGTEFSKDAVDFPLGEKPVLITGIRTGVGDKGTYDLAFQMRRGGEATLSFDSRLLHSFCKLLAGGVEKTSWDIRIGFEAGVEEPRAAEHRLH